METGVYRPTWLPVDTEGGGVRALSFVVDPRHPQYAGELAVADVVSLVAEAKGRFGSCRDYVARAVRVLAEFGVEEPDIGRILKRVDDRADAAS